jgi:lipopolysaccharide exporter
MSGNLTNSAISSLRWNYLGFLTRSAVSFGAGIMLARLLGPKPFGQVAAAMLVFSLANLFADAGFSAALVQAVELTQGQIRFAFTSQVMIAGAMTATAMLTARYVALAFHDIAIQPVLVAIAPLFLLQSLGQTSAGLLRRKLDFRAIQIAQVSSYLSGYLLVGVPAAYFGAGVWSLVAAQLCQTSLFSVQVYARVRHPVVPCFTLSGARLLWFGTKTTANNIVNWGIGNLASVVAGHAFGSISLGLYSRAFNIASVPADGITSTCQQVLFASSSRASHKLSAIRRVYLAAVGAMSLLMFPVFWTLAACADTVVTGLYGARWSAAVPLFRPLAIAMTLHALMALAGPILAATDHVEREVRAQALSLVAAVAVFAIAGRHSVVALAWGVVVVYAFRFGATTLPVLRLLDLRWRDVARVTRGGVLAGVVTSGAVLTAESVLLQCGVKPLYTMFMLALVGAAALCVLFVAAGKVIFPPELVELLRHASLRLPKSLSKVLERVGTRQMLESASGVCIES